MMIKRAVLRVLVVGLFPAMGWLMPASLWGQAVTVAGATLHANAAVAQLEQQAADMFSVPSRFGEAGSLLEKAGRMLPAEDATAIELLIRAARLEHYAGDLSHARACMRAAGWRALGNGLVQVAANAYADAALIAVEQKDFAGAEDLVAIVNLLARWPGVTPGERKQILKRIG